MHGWRSEASRRMSWSRARMRASLSRTCSPAQAGPIKSPGSFCLLCLSRTPAAAGVRAMSTQALECLPLPGHCWKLVRAMLMQH